MIRRICVVCGREFDSTNGRTRCSDKCDKEWKRVYNANYYLKNSTMWQWYAKNKKLTQLGTSNLVSTPKLYRNGEINFVAEGNIIKKELHRLGLR